MIQHLLAQSIDMERRDQAERLRLERLVLAARTCCREATRSLATRLVTATRRLVGLRPRPAGPAGQASACC